MRFAATCFALLCSPLFLHAADLDCASVVAKLNQSLSPKVEPAPLVSTLRTLNQTGALPSEFVTKQQAKAAGWQPGKPFNRIPALQGKSIGGDRFGNFERRLPNGNWREADLGYDGKRRGAQRLIFEPSRSGRRFVTVDHYEHFTEIPACH